MASKSKAETNLTRFRFLGNRLGQQWSMKYPEGKIACIQKQQIKQLISLITVYVYAVQFSHVRLFVTPWTAAHQASLFITNCWSLLKLMFIKLVMPSNHLILRCPLVVPPSIFPSIRVFSSESVLRNRSPNDWSFSFSNSPPNEYSRSPCSLRDSQESSPTSQFKSINKINYIN